MMIKIKVRQITQKTRKLANCRMLCEAVIEFPDIQIAVEQVALTWSKEEGYGCLPPSSEYGRYVHWRKDSEVRRLMTEAIKQAFLAIGGEPPDAPAEHKPKPVPDMPIAEMGLSIDTGVARTLRV